MKSATKPYHQLLIWQRAHQFVKDIYAATAQFPKSEQFGLVSQLRRAAVSVAANIVEGQAKATRADFRRSLSIASSSLAECEYYLELALELRLVSDTVYEKLEDSRGEISFLLNKFMRSLR